MEEGGEGWMVARGVLYGRRRGVETAVDSCAGRLSPLIPLPSRRFGVERGRVEIRRLLALECGSEAGLCMDVSGA